MYEPKVNDYVRWTTALGMVHEGWVYFKAEPSENKKGWETPARYISIEIATKPRPQCDLTHFYIKIFMCVYVVMNRIGTGECIPEKSIETR